MSALILVDVQNDFLPPTGTLAVPGGHLIIAPVLRLLSRPFDLVVASQDYHPRNHVSFATSHARRSPFESIVIPHPVTQVATKQELWPDHCVRNSRGAEFEEQVSVEIERRVRAGKAVVVRKGEDVELDAYSAFSKPLEVLRAERGGKAREQPLTTLLRRANIKVLVVAGLATDFCVRATVLSALAESAQLPRSEQWRVFVVREAVRGVHVEREDQVLNELEAEGARIVSVDGPELEALSL
ncbi:hypothetical protein JCM16303_007375 [Sporobolomyces ruberrimus]